MHYQKKTLFVVPALLCLVLAKPVLSSPDALTSSTQPTQVQSSLPEVHATLVAETLPTAGANQVSTTSSTTIAETLPATDAQVKAVDAAVQPVAHDPAPVLSVQLQAEKQKTVATKSTKKPVQYSHPVVAQNQKKSVKEPAHERVAQPTELVVKLDSPKSAPVQETNGGFFSRMVDATRGLMSRAASWIGTRYVWGGSSRKGIDCSGLTRQLYGKEGVNLPHKAKLQFKRGQVVARSGLMPGDLVFFNTTGPISHVGIYIGEGKFLHAANPRKGVRVDSLSAPYYSKRFAGARRYKDFSDVG